MDEIEQDQVQAERHHQQSDTVQTADDPTCRQPCDAGHETGDHQAADGLGPTVLAEEARGVGADAEEGGVPSDGMPR
jgi:hypothetical protein